MTDNEEIALVVAEFPELADLMPQATNLRGISYHKKEGWMKQISLRIPMRLYIKILLRRVVSRRNDNQEIVHMLEFSLKIIKKMDQQTFDDLIKRVSHECLS